MILLILTNIIQIFNVGFRLKNPYFHFSSPLPNRGFLLVSKICNFLLKACVSTYSKEEQVSAILNCFSS